MTILKEIKTIGKITPEMVITKYEELSKTRYWQEVFRITNILDNKLGRYDEKNLPKTWEGWLSSLPQDKLVIYYYELSKFK